MIIELRQYYVLPGKMSEWLKLMHETILPLQEKNNIKVYASMISEEDETTYIWIRAFDSEADRKNKYQAIYQSDYWVNEVKPKIDQLLDRSKTEIKLLRPADGIEFPIS